MNVGAGGLPRRKLRSLACSPRRAMASTALSRLPSVGLPEQKRPNATARWKLRDLQHEVRDHEPHVALDGGPGEGLDSILHVVSDAGKFLRSGGFLAIEVSVERASIAGSEQSR